MSDQTTIDAGQPTREEMIAWLGVAVRQFHQTGQPPYSDVVMRAAIARALAQPTDAGELRAQIRSILRSVGVTASADQVATAILALIAKSGPGHE